MKSTITINVKAKVRHGNWFMKLRFWIGGKLILLAEWIMRTEIEVEVQQ